MREHKKSPVLSDILDLRLLVPIRLIQLFPMFLCGDDAKHHAMTSSTSHFQVQQLLQASKACCKRVKAGGRALCITWYLNAAALSSALSLLPLFGGSCHGLPARAVAVKGPQ